MADQNAIQKVTPPPAPDLDPAEFGLALVVAATWYFAGPLGIIPTLVLVYKIVGARAPQLPAPVREFGDGLGWFLRLPMADKQAFFLGRPGAPEYAPALPALPVMADEVGDDGAAESMQRLAPPAQPAPAPRRRTAPATAEEAAQQRGAALLERPLYDNDPTTAWGPTILAAQPRWGKSQVQIARLVNDVEAGAEAVWMSSHLTLYHPKDQPTDLRPIADRFEQIGDARQIRDRLHYYVDTVLEERLSKYRRGEDVGHPIALHIGEWPALVAEFGEDIAAPMRRLIREAPKTQVIVSTLDAQDAHVTTLGLGSGVRANFWTKLVGRVDRHTWAALVGDEVPYRELPPRTWYAPGVGLVRFPLPDAQRIRKIAGIAEEPAPVRAPSTGTTQLVQRQAQPAQAARATSTIDLAELYKQAPSLAIKRGYQPPDLIAGLLGIDPATTTIARDGGDVHLHVYPGVSTVPAPGEPIVPSRAAHRPKMFKPKRDQRAARERYYRDAAARGLSFEQAYREEPKPKGNRNQMRELWGTIKG